MNKNSSDPFSSTFSLLAGQGTASRPHYDLTHIEPLPDDPQIIIGKNSHRRPLFIGLVIALLSALSL
jgi:hypothetical protein